MVKGPPSSLLAPELGGRGALGGHWDGGFGIPPWGEEGEARGSRCSRVLETEQALMEASGTTDPGPQPIAETRPPLSPSTPPSRPAHPTMPPKPSPESPPPS